MSQAFSTTALLSTDSSWTTNKIALGIRDCDLLGDRTFGVDQGKRGTRQQYGCRTADLGEVVGGGFSLYPTAAELDWILSRSLGSATSSPWSPAETLPSYHAWIKKGGVQTFKYAGLRTNQLVLSGSELQMLMLRVDCVGEAETEVSDLSPGLIVVDCDKVFPFKSIVLAFGATEFKLKQFSLTINNNIANGQMENNATRSVFDPGELIVGLDVTCGYRSDTKALYRRAIAGDDDVTLTIATGDDTYEFAFGNVKIPGRGPTIPESGEVTFIPSMQITRTDAAAAVVVTKS